MGGGRFSDERGGLQISLLGAVVKTPRSRSAVGVDDIGVEVRAPSGTALSFVRVVFQLT